MEHQILTIKQAAKLLQVDPNTLYRWARAGRFPAGKIGKEWRVLHSDAISFVEKNKHRHKFLTDNQTAELITALAGRREIPLKFQYIGEGADRFVTFEYTTEYGIGQKEIDLIIEHQKEIFAKFPTKNYAVLDLGCGDGKKAAAILSHLEKQPTQKLHYFPLDISERIIDIASSNVALAHPDVTVEAFQEDFEKSGIAKATYYLRRRYQQDILALFLGTTIGNLSDSHRVLVNIREGLTEKDFLLVGLALFSEKKNPLVGYNEDVIYQWLWTIPEKIGIKKTDAQIQLYFNTLKHQIEYKLEFKKDWQKNYGQDTLSFTKGQRILVAISHKFTQDEVFALFTAAGFKLEAFLPNKEKDYGLVLCRPHSWERKT